MRDMKLPKALLVVGLPLAWIVSLCAIPNAGAQMPTAFYLFDANDGEPPLIGEFYPLDSFTCPVGLVYLLVPNGYSMLANCFESYDGPFVVSETFSNQPNGSTIFTMDATGFQANNYLNAWSNPSMPLLPGQAWFFKNPSATFTNMILGYVYFGTNQMPSGVSACSSIEPEAGGLGSDLQFPVGDGDVVYLFNNADNTYSNYVYSISSMSWSPSEPQVAPGQSFWVNKNSATNWVETFPDDSECPSVDLVQSQLASQVGQVNFFTFNATNAALGSVLDVDGVTPLSGDSLGQLYAGTNADDSCFVALGAPTAFSTNAPGYLDGGVVSLPFALGGQAVYVELRAWKADFGATYAAALANGGPVGVSALVSLTAHATIEDGSPGLPPPDVNAFPSFQLAYQIVIDPVPFQITGLTIQSNNVLVAWIAPQGSTNIVQASNGDAAGDCSLANFTPVVTNLFIMPGNGFTTVAATNYLDVGGATNGPTRYYRIELVR